MARLIPLSKVPANETPGPDQIRPIIISSYVIKALDGY